jgi:hypothetical protein
VWASAEALCHVHCQQSSKHAGSSVRAVQQLHKRARGCRWCHWRIWAPCSACAAQTFSPQWHGSRRTTCCLESWTTAVRCGLSDATLSCAGSSTCAGVVSRWPRSAHLQGTAADTCLALACTAPISCATCATIALSFRALLSCVWLLPPACTRLLLHPAATSRAPPHPCMRPQSASAKHCDALHEAAQAPCTCRWESVRRAPAGKADSLT